MKGETLFENHLRNVIREESVCTTNPEIGFLCEIHLGVQMAHLAYLKSQWKTKSGEKQQKKMTECGPGTWCREMRELSSWKAGRRTGAVS